MAAEGGVSMGSKVRVLFIVDDFPDANGGTEGQLWMLLQHLDRNQIEPELLLLRHSQFLLERVGASIPVRALNVHRMQSPGTMARVFKAVWQARRRGVEVAHIFFNDSAVVFPLLLKLVGIRVVAARRDTGFWYTPQILRLLRLNARFTDAVVANCAAVKTAVVAQEEFRAERVQVIYNGIEPKKPSALTDVRRQLSLDATAPLVMIVANLRPLKRVIDAVRALPQIVRAVSDAQLVIVGEDREGKTGRSHRAELEELANDLGVGAHLHFLGKLAEPMSVLHAADVCVLCSETEGLSNSILEYMFCSKPVVCTNVGGNAELVLHGETGYVVEVGDTAALGGRIASLLQQPQQAADFGAAGRRRALSEFSRAHMVERHVALYTALARRRMLPAPGNDRPVTPSG